MENGKAPIKTALILLLSAFVLAFNGCEKSATLSPLSDDTSNTEQMSTSEITTTQGTFQLLNVDPQYNSVFYKKGKGKGKDKDSKKDSVFFAKKFLKKKDGGELKVGNERVGYSKIKFKRNDLMANDTISFSWAPGNSFDGLLTSVVFGPHGAQFKRPVEVELSYKTADLNGIKENHLRFAYYNDLTGKWDLMPCTIDKRKKVVKTKLNHFSRYALVHG